MPSSAALNRRAPSSPSSFPSHPDYIKQFQWGRIKFKHHSKGRLARNL
jgi:hypothetical protein